MQLIVAGVVGLVVWLGLKLFASGQQAPPNSAPRLLYLPPPQGQSGAGLTTPSRYTTVGSAGAASGYFGGGGPVTVAKPGGVKVGFDGVPVTATVDQATGKVTSATAFGYTVDDPAALAKLFA
jgi:hypothetical protein